jgi:hypothetical protein
MRLVGLVLAVCESFTWNSLKLLTGRMQRFQKNESIAQ